MVATEKDQRDFSSKFYALCRYAAAAYLHAGKSPYEALCKLEEGRGVALTVQLDIETDLSRIPHDRDSPVEQYQAVQERLPDFEYRRGFQYHA